MKPVRTTTRDLILALPDRWIKVYPKPLEIWPGGLVFGAPGKSRNTMDILAQLRALDLGTCTVEDVARIIGNDTWTRQVCNACDKVTDVTITVGQEPGWDSCTAQLCPRCVGEADELVDYDNDFK